MGVAAEFPRRQPLHWMEVSGQLHIDERTAGSSELDAGWGLEIAWTVF
jgi:hypothetical protein